MLPSLSPRSIALSLSLCLPLSPTPSHIHPMHPLLALSFSFSPSPFLAIISACSLTMVLVTKWEKSICAGFLWVPCGRGVLRGGGLRAGRLTVNTDWLCCAGAWAGADGDDSRLHRGEELLSGLVHWLSLYEGMTYS